MNWAEITAAAATLFLIMDAFGNAPIFHSVLAKVDQRRHTSIIIRELFIALIILLGFLFTGNIILGFLGLEQSSLSIAGGVLLFVISLRMIYPPSNSGEKNPEAEEPFIVPLAMPLIAGPSTIATLLLLSSNQPELIMEWSIALFLAWLATTILLLLSPKLLKVIGTRGSKALERLMGMILIILATQMLLNGIEQFVEKL